MKWSFWQLLLYMDWRWEQNLYPMGSSHDLIFGTLWWQNWMASVMLASARNNVHLIGRIYSTTKNANSWWLPYSSTTRARENKKKQKSIYIYIIYITVHQAPNKLNHTKSGSPPTYNSNSPITSHLYTLHNYYQYNVQLIVQTCNMRLTSV